MFTSFFIKWYEAYMTEHAETFSLKYNVAKIMVRLSYEINCQVKEYQIRLHNKLQGNALKGKTLNYRIAQNGCYG